MKIAPLPTDDRQTLPLVFFLGVFLGRIQNRFRTNRSFLVVAAVLLLVAGALAVDYFTGLPIKATAHFVGRDQCVACHQPQAERFHGSHHDKAMDLANDQTVLGDFSGVTLEHDGITSRMFRKSDAFMIHTEGPSGDMQDFEIKYVFGVEPLQQYMVEFDREPSAPANEISRVQVLRISWDTIHQRWFYLRPPDVDDKLEPDDPLHWTGIAQRWQTMCAACHSTHLQPNFDPVANRYHTTFSEIDVSCEACHGAGSLHVELANGRSWFWDRHHGYGLAQLTGGDPQPQLQACAPCHSRRAELGDAFEPGNEFCNHFQLETMRADTYHADGQIKDEVYVHGSFLQSRMYHKGIRCTDCHDPHSLQLKHPGNQVCTSCHQHAAGKYDVPSHHHHAMGSEAAQCVSCHMPHTTYMGVDRRRDHSLRIPRPDLSVKLGTPNACSACHVADRWESLTPETRESLRDQEYADWLRLAGREPQQENNELVRAIEQTDQWCEAACETWYGKQRATPDHFAQPVTAFRRGESGSVSEMLRWAVSPPSDPAHLPAIARASILRELSGAGVNLSGAMDSLADIAKDLDENPMVRAAAISAMGHGEPDEIRSPLLPLLQDASTLVRIEVAQTIMNIGAYRSLTGTETLQVDRVLDRDVHAKLSRGWDRTGAHLNWAMIEEQRGHYQQAIDAYKTAIRVEPQTTGARTNLAALLENLADQPSSPQPETLLRKASELRKQELPLLARDAGLLPDAAPLRYRYGLALYLDGQVKAAMQQLEAAVRIAPEVSEYRQARDLLRQKMESVDDFESNP